MTMADDDAVGFAGLIVLWPITTECSEQTYPLEAELTLGNLIQRAAKAAGRNAG